ncbi:site-specific DNA-methyltransferase [Fusobacterium necrophorum]|nr:site-specific DNA-methyltransferase [Fusobacterium necrophorum]AYZ74792.1 site-specific DNA-methyltransferase [Fusobacterium necrophorum]AZW10329.1 site-specific DNA-methyltransferase [Fusobacterium necrophorum subsp. necrophorum]
MDLTQDNIEKLKQIFPEIFTEGKIDLEVLKQLLGDSIETEKERYSFTWNGKAKARQMAQTVSNATLRPEQNVLNTTHTSNLYIEGDNLEVLKLLQKSYHGKIKMIYIDPPYNTGKDFVYKDNFKDSVENYKRITGQINEEGMKLTTNIDSDGRYHSNWLNMMYPRLKLARNLLTEDGVIFISIDEKEIYNLRKICNEIFGEENYLETFHIQVRYTNKSLNEKDNFQPVMEYVCIYSKNKNQFTPNKPYKEYDLKKFKWEIKELTKGEEIVLGNKKVKIFKENEYRIVEKENDFINGLKDTWASGSVLIGNTSGKFFDTYISKRKDIDGLNVLYKVENIGEDGLGYRYFTGPKKETSIRGQFFSGIPMERKEELVRGISKKYSPIVNYYDYSADFGNIRHEGGIAFNSGKKPIKMLKKMLKIVDDNQFICLDFFSGSSSTAHAVMQLNAEDGGNRKFIMVQLPEPCDKNSEAYKAGHKNICEIGKERIRRAGAKIKADESLPFENREKLDIGFKVFKLDSSNIKEWDAETENLERSLFDSVDNIKSDRSELDVLYEILLKYGLDLNIEIEENEDFYSIGGGTLLVNLQKEITIDTINSICEEYRRLLEIDKDFKTTVILRDTSFKNDIEKTNAIKKLEQVGINEIRSI